MSTDTSDIQITGEPLPVPSMCRFTIDRPVYPDRSYFFGNKDEAEESPLALKLFDIDGVGSVLISHNQVTVTNAGHEQWPVIGKQIGAAIRAHVGTGDPAVNDSVHERIPSATEIRDKVQQILDSEVNPSVAAHGGVVHLVDVKNNTVFLQMGGGCQGCGMADVTLKQGVEIAIRAKVREVGDILDTTDHASGRNPYYTPSKQ